MFFIRFYEEEKD